MMYDDVGTIYLRLHLLNGRDGNGAGASPDVLLHFEAKY